MPVRPFIMAKPVQLHPPPHIHAHRKFLKHINYYDRGRTKLSLCGSFNQLAWFIFDELYVLTFVSSKIHNSKLWSFFISNKWFSQKVACIGNNGVSILHLKSQCHLLFYVSLLNLLWIQSSLNEGTWHSLLCAPISIEIGTDNCSKLLQQRQRNQLKLTSGDLFF